MKLEEIAQVSIGVLVNREKDEKGENRYKLFSLKNYEENEQYEELRTNKDLSNKISEEGDLLFRLIYPNKIIYVNKELSNMVIPSQLCIIRANKEIISPIILKWYLESQEAKEQILLKVTGSLIQSITVASLKKIEIPEIDKDTQKTIEELITLWEKEKKVSIEIIEEKEKLYNSYIEDMIKRGGEIDG